MRFLAPARTAVAAATFDHPVFSPMVPWRGLLDGADWPGIDDLDARLSPLRHATTGRELHLVDQAGCALDGQHYETRIHAQGRIATRTENWHDLFNALAWKRLPAVKSALNSRQVADIARNGARQRTRGQDAMTQFDEAGAIVVLRDTALLASWDAHDWQELFLGQRQAWLDGTITLVVVGHALHEHALEPAMWLVAKTLVIDASRGDVPAAAIDTEARSFANTKVRYAGAVPMCGVVGDNELFNYFAGYQVVAQALGGVPMTSFPVNNFATIAPTLSSCETTFAA